MVAGTGANIGNYRNLIRQKEWKSQVVIDIGVLRFPDLGNPFFKVSSDSHSLHSIPR